MFIRARQLLVYVNRRIPCSFSNMRRRGCRVAPPGGESHAVSIQQQQNKSHWDLISSSLSVCGPLIHGTLIPLPIIPPQHLAEGIFHHSIDALHHCHITWMRIESHLLGGKSNAVWNNLRGLCTVVTCQILHLFFFIYHRFVYFLVEFCWFVYN
jgi:hypothetical protein